MAEYTIKINLPVNVFLQRQNNILNMLSSSSYALTIVLLIHSGRTDSYRDLYHDVGLLRMISRICNSNITKLAAENSYVGLPIVIETQEN